MHFGLLFGRARNDFPVFPTFVPGPPSPSPAQPPGAARVELRASEATLIVGSITAITTSLMRPPPNRLLTPNDRKSA